MATEVIAWMAKRIFEGIREEARPKFLHDLKHDKDHVIDFFSQDIGRLSREYTEQGGTTVLNTSDWDSSANRWCAQAIVEHMQNDYLKEELATV